MEPSLSEWLIPFLTLVSSTNEDTLGDGDTPIRVEVIKIIVHCVRCCIGTSLLYPAIHLQFCQAKHFHPGSVGTPYPGMGSLEQGGTGLVPVHRPAPAGSCWGPCSDPGRMWSLSPCLSAGLSTEGALGGAGGQEWQ